MADDFEFTDEDVEPSPQDEFSDDDISGVRSVLNNDIEMEGTLRLRHGIEIKGKYEGEIISNSLIHVKKGGDLRGNINAFHVVLEGSSHSEMTAKKRFEILKGGKFIGSLQQQPEVIVLSEHAVFGSEEKIADEMAAEFTRERSQKIVEESKSK